MTEPSEPPATAAQKPVTPAEPKKSSKLKLLIKLALVLFVLFVLLVVFLPAILSATVLTGIVRGQLQGMFGAGANVEKVGFGWTSGVLVSKVVLPPGPKAKAKDRQPVALDEVTVKVSTIGAAIAAATGGTTDVDVHVGTLKVYFEQSKDGSNLQGIGEPVKPEEKKAAEAAAAAPAKDLPCGATAKVTVDAIDLELMSYANEIPQRVTIEKLKVGLVARVGKDRSLIVEKTNGPAAITFDAIKVENVKDGKAELVLAVEKPSIDLSADVAGAPPADKDVPPGLESALQVKKASPGIAVARVHGADFDLRDLKTTVTVDGRIVNLAVNGILKGLHEGKLGLAVKATLKSKQAVPCEVSFELTDVDISGMVAKQLPKLMPLLDGAATVKGGQHLPTLTLRTKSTATGTWTGAALDNDATAKTVVSEGELKLGPGSFEGSKILAGYLSVLDDLGLRSTIDAAIGKTLAFDGATEKFTVKEGVITIPKIDLASKTIGIALEGKVGFDQKYTFGIHLDDSVYAKLAPDVAKLFRSLDAAGGIRVEGTVGGEVNVTHPSYEELAKAAIKGGAIDLWRNRGGKTAQKLDAAISKAGLGSLEKIADDPKKAAEEAAKAKAEAEAKKAAEGKLGQKIKDKTGFDPSQLLPGSDKKPADPKQPDKKDDKKLELPKIPNPFGGK